MTAQCELNQDDTNGHASVDREKPMRSQFYTIDKLGKLGAGEVVFPREERTNGMISDKLSPPKHVYK